MNTPQVFSSNDEQSYDSFQNLLKEYLGADCWALQIDTEDINRVSSSEYVFNAYMDDKRSVRETIVEQIIREKIIENPHSNLLVYLHRRGRDAEIRIHMFMDQSLTILIHYNADLSLYEIVL